MKIKHKYGQIQVERSESPTHLISTALDKCISRIVFSGDGNDIFFSLGSLEVEKFI